MHKINLKTVKWSKPVRSLLFAYYCLYVNLIDAFLLNLVCHCTTLDFTGPLQYAFIDCTRR